MKSRYGTNTTSTTSSIDINRQKQLEWLFTNHLNFIQDAARASDRTLHPADYDNIERALGCRLADYTGPATDEAFREWAGDAVTAAVERLAQLRALRTPEHEYHVRRGITRVLSQCRDLGDVDDALPQLVEQTWYWIFDRIDGFAPNTRAKMSTRLYGAGYDQARGWKSDRIRDLKKYGRWLGIDEDGEIIDARFIEGVNVDGKFSTPAC